MELAIGCQDATAYAQGRASPSGRSCKPGPSGSAAHRTKPRLMVSGDRLLRAAQSSC
eukprot:CAMPEP_0174313006 /NCGR_PEP_ID=MMETSP0810-20121108/4684_1 /TAXON_ID=73025 ORGANISM="Eutreptiella gymnastica-like, Strain CCMP1594" /NCGR_SAMPLE_ID=MMETSP0810 /ASSEMBLY_ACC=CAM_ASM_000659 /LENGTH=56 /DNA_ID=CAMNT_0015421619 /DNA_START=1814 /DNA_END=1984 /DNA_ORIENTATION=+